jgi:hypothetical protein
VRASAVAQPVRRGALELRGAVVAAQPQSCRGARKTS